MKIRMVALMFVIFSFGLAHFGWAQTTPSVSGTVQQYLLNPHGELEGILLKEGAVVRFPPHLSAALAATIKPGDAVTVVGFFGPTTSYGQAVKALSITNAKTAQMVIDQ